MKKDECAPLRNLLVRGRWCEAAANVRSQALADACMGATQERVATNACSREQRESRRQWTRAHGGRVGGCWLTCTIVEENAHGGRRMPREEERYRE